MKRFYKWVQDLSWGWVFIPSTLILYISIVPDITSGFLESHFGIKFPAILALSIFLFQGIVMYLKKEVPILSRIRGTPAMILSGFWIIGLLFLIIGILFSNN
jgi:hypothetical protein